MSNRNEALTEWCAEAVDAAIDASGRTKLSIAEETGIPYSTLNRKLAAKADFMFRELLAIADALGVKPSQFTPPPFKEAEALAA